jgi:hypothetical protein
MKAQMAAAEIPAPDRERKNADSFATYYGHGGWKSTDMLPRQPTTTPRSRCLSPREVQRTRGPPKGWNVLPLSARSWKVVCTAFCCAYCDGESQDQRRATRRCHDGLVNCSGCTRHSSSHFVFRTKRASVCEACSGHSIFTDFRWMEGYRLFSESSNSLAA